MKKQVVVHPLLFSLYPIILLRCCFPRLSSSLYPIILLYSTNFGLVEFPDVIGTALATVCLSVLFWWVVTHFISDYKRAGLIVTAVIIVIFSFEAFCQQLLKVSGKFSRRSGSHHFLGAFSGRDRICPERETLNQSVDVFYEYPG